MTKIKYNKIVILPLFLLLIMLITVNIVNSADNEIKNMELIKENPFLKLYIDEKTTAIAVKDKTTGSVWYSNPPGSKKNYQFEIDFFTPGDQELDMDNYQDSVEYDQYQIKQIDEGIRIDYTVGQEYGERTLLPTLISKDRVNEVQSGLANEKNQKKFLNTIEDNYILLKAVPEKEGEELTLPSSLTVFEGYTLISPDEKLDTEDIKEYMRNILNRIQAGRFNIEKRSEIEKNDIEFIIGEEIYVLDDSILDFLIGDIVKNLKDSGYTMKDKAKDCLDNNLDPPSPKIEVFKVPIEYKLEGKNFIVRIPVKEIKYPQDIIDVEGKYGRKGEEITLPLYSISLLEYFGSASQDDNGYLFVPDGSGALINLNNNKKNSKAYISTVYGLDQSLKQKTNQPTLLQKINLPIYGLKKEKEAFLAIIEKSAYSASIKADIARNPGDRNIITPRFIILPKGETSLRGRMEVYTDMVRTQLVNSINIYQSRPNQEDIQIRYKFLEDENANYVGMAKYYQQYLENKGFLTSLDNDQGAPFYLDLIGAVKKDTSILGFPRLISKALTPYQGVREIVNTLKENNIDNVKIKYSGWFNQGLNHSYPQNIDLIDSLGEKDELIQLLSFLKENNIELFPDVSFLNVYQDNWFDGFSQKQDTARFIDKNVAKIFEYNAADYTVKNSKYLLKPSELDPVTDSFLDDYQKYNIDGLSLRYMGTQLASDFRSEADELIDRKNVKNIIEEQLQKFKDNEYKIMVESANSYVLPYTKDILNLAFNSSNYDIIDESIPFYQIVLHGYINYASEPINQALDYEKNILKTIEGGGNLYYRWSYENPEIIRGVEVDKLYSLYYKNWLQTSNELYQKLIEYQNQIYDQKIINHQKLKDNVYETVYENGYSTIVNYNKEDIEVKGKIVEGMDYLLIKGGKQDVE